ncbi:uncharacterized protein N7484_001167 [Penicillium longicatenatum]|uniref:uncharacterized protein n=1 Tax=Penicillium longicatenatum TaxID=1561947 RepID=UPI002549AB28|nr:uncharacterized protein N7484_001167 [Penicillium longicatenatum]KAJ5657518.1 hypothetical protein N7484_001167 [Penicillium longicatenatum]
MFYSHEILTSPEHGVATIWLVATLGSRSITRRFNRKAILEVDVPGACNVIVDPEAPMALRLQGNLLFGVSRVYQEQCGYALLDAQSMHDKMVSTLEILPGGGLDPFAGKTKPSNLLLPYDPTFLPETNLPGLNIDFNILDLMNDESSSQWSSLWSKSPAGSQSSASRLSVHLELESDDLIQQETMIGFNDGGMGSFQKHGLSEEMDRERLGGEDGVLLQPDFEFDENGNIIEFDASHLSPRKRRKHSMARVGSEGFISGQTEDIMDLTEDAALAQVDGALEIDTRVKDHETMLPVKNDLNEERSAKQDENQFVGEKRARRKYTRVIRPINTDTNTTLRNTDLARWNNEYTTNMANASKQKQQNRVQTTAKKNAAFWVFGQGIGSVGMGLGAQREDHPLKCFSGEKLENALYGDTSHHKIQNEPCKPEEESNTDTDTDQQRRSHEKSMNSVDIEIGRHAPPSLMEEHSSQMPWNLNSAQSSRIGRLGNLSELSAKIGPGDSTGLRGVGRRGRFTSASPLAGRGYPEQLGSLSLQGGDGLDGLDEDLEISRYLAAELAADKKDITTLSRQASASQRVASQLDQESMNFFDFIQDTMDGQDGKSELAFSDLLPPGKTSRTVATQGLMNVLTLATHGILSISQEPSHDAGIEYWGTKYEYGEIFMRVEGV